MFIITVLSQINFWFSICVGIAEGLSQLFLLVKFMILMGCGLAHFGIRGLKTP